MPTLHYNRINFRAYQFYIHIGMSTFENSLMESSDFFLHMKMYPLYLVIQNKACPILLEEALHGVGAGICAPIDPFKVVNRPIINPNVRGIIPHGSAASPGWQ